MLPNTPLIDHSVIDLVAPADLAMVGTAAQQTKNENLDSAESGGPGEREGSVAPTPRTDAFDEETRAAVPSVAKGYTRMVNFAREFERELGAALIACLAVETEALRAGQPKIAWGATKCIDAIRALAKAKGL